MNAKINKTLKRYIKELNEEVALKGIRQDLLDDLYKRVVKEKVDSVFNGDSNAFENLNNEEQTIILEKMYLFTKDNELNPYNLFTSARKEYNFYNEEFKKTYLINSGYIQSAVQSVKTMFLKASEMEFRHDKDLYNFNREMVLEFVKFLKPKTKRSAQNYISKVNRYLDFAKSEGRVEENVLSKAEVDADDLVDKEAEDNMIFSKDAIMQMAEYADNPQDGVLLGLIFDGVSYKDKYTELVELTEQMVDYDNNEIHLPARTEGENEFEARTIDISSTTSRLIRMAMEEEEYLSITGETSRSYKIAESNHVLRGVRKGREKINWRNINQRILRLSEQFEEELLNATAISYSGQMYYADKLLKAGHDIESCINSVFKKFAIPNNPSSQFNFKTKIEKYLGTK